MKHTHTVMGAKLRRQVNENPEYTRCALTLPHDCRGRITRSHDVYVAGKKVQRMWAVPPICAAAHGVDEFQDAGTMVPQRMRRWVALNRATDEELMEFPKAGLIRERERLNLEYGPYIAPPIPQHAVAIAY